MIGIAGVMRAAAAGTMTADLNGGNLVESTRASLLLESAALEAKHMAQLAATVGTSAYVDGVVLSILRLTAKGRVTTPTTLSEAIFAAITAVRAVGYLPLSNISDSDPSVYFLTHNFVTICDALEQSVLATGATVSSSNNFFTTPVVILVAAYVVLCAVGCLVVYRLSRRALDVRMLPLEYMMKLPNTVLQRLESAAAIDVAAAERVVEYGHRANHEEAHGEGDDDDGLDDWRADTDWRSVLLMQTSKDMQKSAHERPRDRVIFTAILVAPLIVSSVVLILLVSTIWTGVQAAGVNSNALTEAMLAEMAAGQVVYYGMLGATRSDLDGSAIIATAVIAQGDAAKRADNMFFGPSGDMAADGALHAIHFGDLCDGSIPLSANESGRCGALGGGVCRSGLHEVYNEIVWSAAAMLNARAALTYSASPTPLQTAALRRLMDAQYITDMRILQLVELRAGMTIDGGVRAARVQAAGDSAINTGTWLVSLLIVATVLYTVCVCARAAALLAAGGRVAA